MRWANAHPTVCGGLHPPYRRCCARPTTVCRFPATLLWIVDGELAGDFEALESTYRSHGSLHESDVPLVIYNYAGEIPEPGAFKRNSDLVHFVLR